MASRRRITSGIPWGMLPFTVLLLLGVPAAEPAPAQETAERGQAVYDRWCAACHGVDGDGEGPAAEWMLPRPRDFTGAVYQIRSTPSGQIPTDDDILRVINEGMPGTTMPGWEDHLSRGDRQALVEYLKSFSPFFEGPEAEPMDFGRAPRGTEERIAEGREVYDRVECWQCHGPAGRGDGGSAPELEDAGGLPIRAADLTKNWRFNGGASVEQIYRRMKTGMDGTPMPSQQDLIDAGIITDDELWSLAHYVRSLSPDRPPRVREVVAAELVDEDEALPGSPTDERWDEVERFWIPLAGQIVIEPRWFEPTVRGVWVRALHDGEELALLLEWTDPSESPNPRWMQWQERIVEAMEPKEGAEPHEPEPRPDRFTVQFPRELPEGSRRPRFLMGDAQNPVYLWRWSSDGSTTGEYEARGMENQDALPATTSGLTSEARWEDGRWRLLFRRSLETQEAQDRIQFETGRAIPIAFFAWDGDNGESGTRGAISSWYYIFLQEETPPTVFVTPVIAMIVTGLLGVVVVARAQKREKAARRREEEGEGAPGDRNPGP